MINFYSYFKIEDLTLEQAHEFINKLFEKEIYNNREKEYSIQKIAYILLNNFTEVDEKLRNSAIIKLKQCLEFLIENRSNDYFNYSYNIEKLSKVLIRIILENYNILPEFIKELFIKHSENPYILRSLLHELFLNFKILPPPIKNLIFKNIIQASNSKFLAEAIELYYDKLPGYKDYDIPQELINKLFKEIKIYDYYNKDIVIRLIHKHFGKFPYDKVIEIIFKISDERLTINKLDNKLESNKFIKAIKNNFEKIPKEVINRVIPVQAKFKLNQSHILHLMKIYPESFNEIFDLTLLIISEDTEVGSKVIEFLDFVKPEVKSKIIENLFKNKQNLRPVIRSIIRYYEDLPLEIKKIIFSLSTEDENIHITLGCSIFKYYNKLPKQVQNLLKELSKNSIKLKEIIKLTAPNKLVTDMP